MQRIKLAIFRFVRRVGQKGEHVFHVAYLGMVGIEAHGNYRYAAIGLLLMVLANLFVGEE